MILIGRIITMLHTRYLSGFLSLFFVLAFFLFIPKVYADDACDPITTPPLLYQIDREPTKATLYFTPISNDQVQNYVILYGLTAEDERYSITLNQGVSTGAISYTINDLLPGVQYFYKVNGSTSCTTSPWSTWVGDKAVATGSAKIVPLSSIPVTGPQTFFPAMALAGVALVGGLSLFAFSKRKTNLI